MQQNTATGYYDSWNTFVWLCRIKLWLQILLRCLDYLWLKPWIWMSLAVLELLHFCWITYVLQANLMCLLMLWLPTACTFSYTQSKQMNPGSNHNYQGTVMTTATAAVTAMIEHGPIHLQSYRKPLQCLLRESSSLKG